MDRRAPERRVPGGSAWTPSKGALLAASAMLVACGHAQAPVAPSAVLPAPSSAAPASSPAPAALAVRDLGALLPQGLLGLAAAPVGGRIYLLGGGGPDGTFSDTIYAFDPAATTLTVAGHLPVALHDGGAAASGGGVLFCGGGQAVGSTAIYLFRPGAGVTTAGELPRPLSDVEGLSVGGAPYCLGGWTGGLYSDAVYALGTLTGGSPPVVAHLPHAVRYAAAAAVSGGALVAGGRVSDGGPTAAIQWVPLGPGAAAPSVVGQLPQPLAYAMAAPLGDAAVVAGGCDSHGTPVSDIEVVTPQGQVRAMGTLPAPLCYGAAAASGSAVYLFGGQAADGVLNTHVYEITAAQPPAG